MANKLNEVKVFDELDPTQLEVTYSTVANGDKIEHVAVYPKNTADLGQVSDYEQKLIIGSNRIFTKVTDYEGQVFEETILEVNDIGLPVASQQYPFTLNPKVKDYGDGTYWKQPGLSLGLDGFTTLHGLLAITNSDNPIVNGDVIATLPDRLAPNLTEMFIVGTDNGPARIDVRPTGEIVYTGTTSILKYVSLSGIRFLSTQ